MTLSWPDEQPCLTDGLVTMRAWSLDDIEAVYQACQAADIQRYTTVPVPYLREHAEHFVREVAPQGWAQKTAAGFAVTGRADGRLLGACGLAAVAADERSSGAGYWVAPWGRGRGVAARALTLLTSWAFDAVGLQRIQM